jgi:ADP-heptose:LPS heptosyltransferase
MTADAGAESPPPRIPPRILVICARGLARFVPALGVMASLRASHTGAQIILLTAAETAGFAATTPYFDEVWTDETLGNWDIPHILNLRRRLRGIAFDRVYDLDCDSHSLFLFRLMHGFWRQDRTRIAWSGAIPGTILAHTDLRRTAMHLADRWAAQLKLAGIPATLRPDLSWVARHVKSFSLPFRMTDPFVLVAATAGPGGSAANWSAGQYGELAAALGVQGQRPVLVESRPRPDLSETMTAHNPATIDLSGKGNLNELVLLAWAATAAVGPDNGIMHLLAVAGCRSVVLYDQASDPALVGPRGSAVTVLRRPRLADIPVGEVIAAAVKGRPAGTAQHPRTFT